jgi:hypothetical protein
MILEYRSTALAMYELGVGEGYRDPDSIKRRYFTLPTLDDEPDNDPESSDQDPPTAPIDPTTQQQSGPNTLSAIRIDINMKWMNAAQEMLDTVLACSIDTMRKLPNLMYTRLATAMTALLKIHYSVRTGALGEVVTPETVNVAYYIDAIAAKLGEAGGGGKFKIPSRWYQVVGVRGRDWYERLERRYSGNPSGVTGLGMRVSPSMGTAEPMGISAQTSGRGSASHHSTATPSSHHSQPQTQSHAQTHLSVNPTPNSIQSQNPSPAMDPYPISAAVSPIPPHAHTPGLEGRYVAMAGGASMWAGAGPSPMDSQNSNANPQFFHSLPPGYQPSPAHSLPAMQPQFAYEAQQRMAAQGHVQVHPHGHVHGQPQAPGPGMHGTGMELDGWMPDGSIFGMPPLPEF